MGQLTGLAAAAVGLGASDDFQTHVIGTIHAFMRRSSKRRECVVDLKTKFHSEKVQAQIYLGVTIAGIETLVGLGIILLLMK